MSSRSKIPKMRPEGLVELEKTDERGEHLKGILALKPSPDSSRTSSTRQSHSLTTLHAQRMTYYD